MRGAVWGRADRGPGGDGLLAQLRTPPGGRDARTMLLALLVDRTGTGVWSTASVLYFTFVVGLDAAQVGLLLGVAGAAAVAGSPLAGWLAGRHRLRSLLIGSHLVRMAAVCLLLVCGSFGTLLPVVAAICVADRAAKTWEILFATRTAGERRATYRALSRVVMNAGYGIGAGIAAVGLAVGTRDAYGALVLGDALSFLAAAALVGRTREVRTPPDAPVRPGTAVRPDAAMQTDTAVRTDAAAEGRGRGRGERRGGGPSPWRDPGYLLFVLLDTPLGLDDAILNVGLPLWLVSRTAAPHAVVPAFMIVNTVLVVLLQMPVSARVGSPRRAALAVGGYGLAVLGCCVLVAFSAAGGALTASVLLLGAAVLVTVAELVRSVSSWELAVCLAPARAQPAYLGVAGMAQSVSRSAGPVLLTDVVMAAGPAGWLVLGTAVTGLSIAQRGASLRRIATLQPAADVAIDASDAVASSGAVVKVSSQSLR
ncbi:MFS transporter [Streptacidiphilus sp. EB129]|uniref:MFS transporter n=1 Tax=Streptacidiphilus sp. EB129 TaxID=3156262 RepID=UPI003516EC77